MRAIIGGLATALLTIGCGGGSNTCEDAIANAAKIYGFGGASYADMRKDAIQNCKDEKWSDQLRACAAAAKTRSDFDACEKHTKEKDDRPSGGRRSEAELNLDAIKKALKVVYVETAAYPSGSAPLTPAAPCCDGPNHKCPVDANQWVNNPVWSALDFELTEPGYFQYAYESTEPQKARATAVGDLDCDGTTVTYVLECNAETGNPTCTLIKPTNRD